MPGTLEEPNSVSLLPLSPLLPSLPLFSSPANRWMEGGKEREARENGEEVSETAGPSSTEQSQRQRMSPESQVPSPEIGSN